MMAIHSRVAKNTTSKKPQLATGKRESLGLELDSPDLSLAISRDELENTAEGQENSVSAERSLIPPTRQFLAGSWRRDNGPPGAPGQQIYSGLNGVMILPRLARDEYPETALDSTDYAKRLRFEELKRTKLEEMCSWKQKDVKGIKKNAYIKEVQKKNERILSVADKDELERLEVMTDRFPLLELRKAISKSQILLQMTCKWIISTSVFDNFTTLVILVNSVVMMQDNPANKSPDPAFASMEGVFLILYTGEMVLKILGMGLIFAEESYLKDSWNILDFTIVISSLLALKSGEEETVLEETTAAEEGFSMQSLRSFRVMRPLKTISSVQGLKVLMGALLSSIPLLVDTLIILFGFFLVFSIAGCQLLKGLLKKRCFNIQTGRLIADDSFCSSTSDCPGGYFCGKGNDNPNKNTTNFDNVMFAFLAVFQSVTLEGWSDI